MAESERTDVFVVGGGPAGLAAAIAARRKGFRVTLADVRTPPIDKACGEGLMPNGQAAAKELGVCLENAESFVFQGIRFRHEDVAVEADFPGMPGIGVRRTVLHKALADEAERSGVDLQWGRSVSSQGEIAARWVVGADGASSVVRRWAGLDRFAHDGRRFGFRFHVRVAPWVRFVEIYWGRGCQVYVTPVSTEEVGVALLSRDPHLRVKEALKQFPDLMARLAGRLESSLERGAVTGSRRLRRVTDRNTALIGDASGSVDAITGEGLCLAFRQALELADALEKGDLSLYETAHRRLALRPRFMAALLLTMDQRDWLRRRVIGALGSRPDLFRKLLAMHVGAAGPAEFAASCLELGWQLAIRT